MGSRRRDRPVKALCSTRWALAFVLILVGKDAVSDDVSGLLLRMEFGTVQRSAIWFPRDAAQKEIKVCWENPDASNDVWRKSVQDAVTTTWQRYSRLMFSGWDGCQTGSMGLRILISDAQPVTQALGRYLNGRPNGMTLNFTFKNWGSRCLSAEFCIRAIAVHEFGHAIGFAHEQNRIDAPPECASETDAVYGDWNVSTYDSESVMNYCNKNWNGNGTLSSRDISAVQTVYGR